MSKKGRVLVAMSGGIDSSVTAAMLHAEGYEVVGLTMKTWDYANAGGQTKETGCCSLDSINDARVVAVNLGFPHYIIDIREEFGDYVIENFVEEYLAGRTPNPCVLCNTHIKWDALLRRADKMDCEFIATGHYAQVRLENGRHVISKGKDENKDQSYVLWGLKQQSLARTMFPMGKFHKQEIREMAKEMGYHHLVAKPESYEICFIPDNDYHGFLNRQVEGLEDRVNGGNFVLADGTVVGKHKGYPYYTIGQRKGIIAMGEPYYVTGIQPETNTVVIGKEEDLLENKMRVRGLNLIKYPTLQEDTQALTKIRYKDPGAPSLLQPVDERHVDVFFPKPVKAITPGQSAVFYEGNDVLGGGWIQSVG
jgi:tRNA-specific 2-thiouridylase